ncbi:MAG TPA: phosphoadenylyl-sulfate reductase [Thermoplasmata archaeon]|nr:phosphoadenylyl-sulfate reductase [Thermoplasmata archaeon]
MTLQAAYDAAQAEVWSREFEGRPAAEIIRWAVDRFGDGLVIGSSFGKDSLVIMELARRLWPEIPILFLETGYHFAETLQFRDHLRVEFKMNIVDVRPDLTVPEQDAEFGAELFARAPDQCCEMRKVAPLHQALAGRRAWITGVRRSQHPQRADTPVVEWQEISDRGIGVFKVNPLVAWSLSEVDAFLEENHLPRHPLWAKGYPSVGCAPCTAPASLAEGERAGRWRGQGKIECGIHVAGVRRSGAPEIETAAPERA